MTPTERYLAVTSGLMGGCAVILLVAMFLALIHVTARPPGQPCGTPIVRAGYGV